MAAATPPVLTAAKRLELLKEIVPNLSRVAVAWTPESPASRYAWKEMQLLAQRLGVRLHSLELRNSNDLSKAFEEAAQAGAQALISTSGVTTHFDRKIIMDLAVKNRLPAIFSNAANVKAGGLVSYNRAPGNLYRRAATYVHKILNGAKPGDLPVEQPTKFFLTVNLKTAKALGITFPPSILLRADRVIE